VAAQACALPSSVAPASAASIHFRMPLGLFLIYFSPFYYSV